MYSTLDKQLCLYYNYSSMKLLINPKGDTPIYEQIELQIKEQIVKGELPAGTMLPSIRMLAKELKIGIITAKRVYDDLTAEGYTRSVAGKGVFVAEINVTAMTFAGEQEVKKRLESCVAAARANGITEDKFLSLAEEVWKNR